MIPATLLWNQAVNWMVTGEIFDGDPYLRRGLGGQEERRMSVEEAKAEIRDRLESGEAIAAGRRRVRYDPAAGETDAVPREIPAPEWPALRIDYATSFAEAVKASIPGQGYVDVRLKRADVIAAYEAVIARKLAARALLGPSLFSEPPIPSGNEAVPPDTGEPRAKRPGGRPPKPYKEAVIAAAVKWLDYEGFDQGGRSGASLAQLKKFIWDEAAKMDEEGGPAKGTIAAWASEALRKYEQMRANAA